MFPFSLAYLVGLTVFPFLGFSVVFFFRSRMSSGVIDDGGERPVTTRLRFVGEEELEKQRKEREARGEEERPYDPNDYSLVFRPF